MAVGKPCLHTHLNRHEAVTEYKNA